MKKIKLIGLMLMILGSPAVFAASATGKVAVLYNGRTQVNRHVLQFMGEQIRASGSSWQFEAFGKGSDINREDYVAVVIINTGVASGVDRTLSDFINSWPDKSRLILVSLYKGRRDLTVETVPAASQPEGVDAVSAASLWQEGGFSSLFGKGNGGSPRQMHARWVQEVLRLIDSKA